ncbi:Nitroreductase [Rhizodiscina lignyota]|uniref:Nitroreductase n=1 Tax=Rhizodiscina lignyota TaxID=1504668 RepID=A0A9P4IH71_9PEZI|nr:Nitroreductase [Rhizodiscina lignyota]
MAAKTSFFDAMVTRRSIYALASESPIPDERIIEIVNHAIVHCPSPFNVQSARAVILIGKEHQKLWDIAYEAAEKLFPAPVFEGLKPRIAGFRGGYGTVMWFEDAARFNVLEEQMGAQRWAGVRDKMPQWSEHSSGMHQYAVWTALEAEGLGCNLQHYNPLVDQRVQEEWKVPVDWSLKAQMVFGKPVGPPRDKTALPVGERVFVHKS